MTKRKSRRPPETKEERVARLEKWKLEEDQQREELNGEKSKEARPLSIIFSGHVDHGKSSMSGHILVNMQKVDER